MSDEDLEQDYEILKTIEIAIVEKLFVCMNDNNTSEYFTMYDIIQDLMTSAKILRASKHDIEQLYMSDMLIIQERAHMLKQQMIDIYLVFSHTIAGEKNNHSDDILIKNTLAHKQSIEILSKVLHREHISGFELTSLLHLTSALDMAHHAYHDGIIKLFE